MLHLGALAWNGLTAAEVHLFKQFVLVSTTLSLCGAAFIISAYSIFWSLRDFSLRLIFFLTLSDIGLSIGFLMDQIADINIPAVCQAQATLLQFFSLVSVCWTCAVAHTLYHIVIHPDRSPEQYVRWYHAVSWGIPAILAGGCFAAGVFGQSEMWCWITEKNSTWRFAAYFVPAFIGFMFNIATYLWLAFRIYRKPASAQAVGPEDTKKVPLMSDGGIIPAQTSWGGDNSRTERWLVSHADMAFDKVDRSTESSCSSPILTSPDSPQPIQDSDRRLIPHINLQPEPLPPHEAHLVNVDRLVIKRISLYLLVYILCWIPSITNRFQDFFDPDHPWVWLYAIQSVVSPLQGFLNSLVYGGSHRLRVHLVQLCSACMPCMKSSDNEKLVAYRDGATGGAVILEDGDDLNADDDANPISVIPSGRYGVDDELASVISESIQTTNLSITQNTVVASPGGHYRIGSVQSQSSLIIPGHLEDDHPIIPGADDDVDFHSGSHGIQFA